jgi:hypothetical protein
MKERRKIVESPGKAYTDINRLAKKYPDNKFLAISAAMTSPDYENTEKDEELLNLALKKKYGI